MPILSVDTSFSIGSVAVADDQGVIIASLASEVAKPHSFTLFTLIDSVLLHASLELGDITLFAVGVGPGSFTGLRIGVGAVAGFADALGVDAVGVDSLEALVYAHDPQISDQVRVRPVIYAKKDELFAACFMGQGNRWCRIDENQAFRPADFADSIDGPTICIGDGFAPFADLISSRSAYPIEVASTPNRVVAVGVAQIAAGYADANQLTLHPLTPRYVRRAQAEIEWDRLHTTI